MTDTKNWEEGREGFLRILREKSVKWTASSIAALVPASFIITFGAFIVIIFSVFWPYVFTSVSATDKTLLHELGDTSIARGLITFLVSVSTVAIGLILVLFVSVAAADQEIKDRFAFGKEVLTALVGILGTIIGFYFGQAAGPAGQGTNQPPNQVSQGVLRPNVQGASQKTEEAAQSENQGAAHQTDKGIGPTPSQATSRAPSGEPLKQERQKPR